MVPVEGGGVSLAADVTRAGERVTHLYPNDGFYAHLSLYRFAATLGEGALVLDAGCGAGYGAAYLADHGATLVHAVDFDPAAVAFCRAHFRRPNLVFAHTDLLAMVGLPAGAFDLVVASNTLEHLADVPRFLRTARALLKPGGALMVAVPPVTAPAERLAELANPHHLNIWTPRQWRHVLGQYFGAVDGYVHRFTRAGVALDFRNTPAATVIDETDFRLDPVASDDAFRGTYTVVFVATRPQPADRLPSPGAPPVLLDGSITRRPPRLAPLAPDLLARPARPLRALPARAGEIVRERGVGGLLAEGRRYAIWLVRRFLARRVVGRRDPPGGP